MLIASQTFKSETAAHLFGIVYQCDTGMETQRVRMFSLYIQLFSAPKVRFFEIQRIMLVGNILACPNSPIPSIGPLY